MKYTFRAECSLDVLKLVTLLPFHDLRKFEVLPLKKFPDLEVSIELEKTTLEELRDIMRKVEDGHVMVQTLAEADKYTGERDYSL